MDTDYFQIINLETISKIIYMVKQAVFDRVSPLNFEGNAVFRAACLTVVSIFEMASNIYLRLS